MILARYHDAIVLHAFSDIIIYSVAVSYNCKSSVSESEKRSFRAILRKYKSLLIQNTELSIARIFILHEQDYIYDTEISNITMHVKLNNSNMQQVFPWRKYLSKYIKHTISFLYKTFSLLSHSHQVLSVSLMFLPRQLLYDRSVSVSVVNFHSYVLYASKVSAKEMIYMKVMYKMELITQLEN